MLSSAEAALFAASAGTFCYAFFIAFILDYSWNFRNCA
jgi:hypothetical protein